jgi:hypothetical protein
MRCRANESPESAPPYRHTTQRTDGSDRPRASRFASGGNRQRLPRLLKPSKLDLHHSRSRFYNPPGSRMERRAPGQRFGQTVLVRSAFGGNPSRGLDGNR